MMSGGSGEVVAPASKPATASQCSSSDEDESIAIGDGASRMCKFCYGTDPAEDWLHPCRCSGTMKWVHGSCFSQWLTKAPSQQQVQCLTCKYIYRKYYVLKAYNEWCRPPLRLSMWEVLEILLDVYSTAKFLRGFWNTLAGRRGIFMQIAHTIFWRCFIATDRRLMYYANLGRVVASSVFNVSVENYKDAPIKEEEEEVEEEEPHDAVEE